jgi:hypothetical protein
VAAVEVFGSSPSLQPVHPIAVTPRIKAAAATFRPEPNMADNQSFIASPLKKRF